MTNAKSIMHFLKKSGVFSRKLDLESIGSSLGIDYELIWSGVEWSGPAIIPGLDNRHLINHRMSYRL